MNMSNVDWSKLGDLMTKCSICQKQMLKKDAKMFNNQPYCEEHYKGVIEDERKRKAELKAQKEKERQAKLQLEKNKESQNVQSTSDYGNAFIQRIEEDYKVIKANYDQLKNDAQKQMEETNFLKELILKNQSPANTPIIPNQSPIKPLNVEYYFGKAMEHYHIDPKGNTKELYKRIEDAQNITNGMRKILQRLLTMKDNKNMERILWIFYAVNSDDWTDCDQMQ